MKTSAKSRIFFHSVFWGIVLILAAVVLILDGAGMTLGLGLTPWRIVGAVLLTGWLICEIVRLRFTNIFFPAAFLFLVLEQPIAGWLGRGDDLISNWIVLVAALLLTIGTKAVFHPRGDANGDAVHGGRIGSQTLYFDAADLSRAVVANHVGSTEVYLTNCDAYPGEGTLSVRDNVGPVNFHLPADWRVVTDAADNIGPLNIPPQDGVASHTVTLKVRDNVGPVSVVFDKAE